MNAQTDIISDQHTASIRAHIAGLELDVLALRSSGTFISESRRDAISSINSRISELRKLTPEGKQAAIQAKLDDQAYRLRCDIKNIESADKMVRAMIKAIECSNMAALRTQAFADIHVKQMELLSELNAAIEVVKSSAVEAAA